MCRLSVRAGEILGIGGLQGSRASELFLGIFGGYGSATRGRMQLDATFQYPTGGAEAIDTALKILHGERVPKDIVLGTRLFDKDNVAQGGVALQ